MKRIPLLVAILVLSTACDDGGGDDPQPVCEETCANTGFDNFDACAVSYRDCALLCTGFTDTACITACGDSLSTCNSTASDSLSACTGACPCTTAQVSCETACAGDTTCIDGCDATYETCLGQDIDAVNACMGTCNSAITPCSDTCTTNHSDPPDYPGFVNCIYACYDTLDSCNRACY